MSSSGPPPRPEVRSWGVWPIALWGFALVGLSSLVIELGDTGGLFVPAFRRLLREDRSVVLPLCACGLAGLLALRAPGRLRALAVWLTEHPRSLAAATFLVCLCLGRFSLKQQPLAMDEVAPLFQARVFASGELSAQFRPDQLKWLFNPGFLQVFLLAKPATGQVISGYWPGLAMLLAPLELIGCGAALNPALAAAAVLLTRYVALRMSDGDRELTGCALALLLASPAFLFTAASFYAMNAHLCANLAFVALLLVPSPRRLLAAGAVGGLALSLHNPLPHLLFAWPWWALQLLDRDRARRCTWLALGYVSTGALLVVAWFVFSEGFRSPDGALVGKSALASPGAALLLARAQGLAKLVLWSPFALLPMAVCGAWLGRRQRLVQALTLSALSTLLAYVVVKFDQGHGWGYRYFHPAYGTLPLLCLPFLASTQRARVGAIQATLGWCLAGLALVLPERARTVERFVAAHRAQLVSAPPGQTCVHVVRPLTPNSGDLIANDPGLRGELYLFNPGEQPLAELRASQFPHTTLVRQTWVDSLYCGELSQYRRFALSRAEAPSARVQNSSAPTSPILR